MTLLAQAKKLCRSRGILHDEMSHVKRLAIEEYDLQGHSISLHRPYTSITSC